jgi:hypothetical protein
MSFDTFVPDLIVGLATGLAVGAVFIVYERYLTGRRDSAEAQAHSSRLVHPLLLTLQRLEEEPNYERVVPLPRRIERALALVEASDLDRWRHLTDSLLVTRLFEFRDAAWDLREDAQDLDVAIRRWQRLHEMTPGTAEYGTAELLNAPPQYLTEVFPDAAQRRALRQAAEEFKANRLVKKHARHYRKAHVRTERELDALREVLAAEIRIQRGERSTESPALDA